MGLSGFLSHPVFTYLGNISFPIFILHGALGQLFYKKIVATKARGRALATPAPPGLPVKPRHRACGSTLVPH